MIDGDALVEFTRELVRIPSVYDPARRLNEQPAAEAVEAQMRAFGWSPRVDLVAAGRPNVIATIDGDRPGRTLLFEGHTDVVTEGDEHAWTVEPFGAELRDGRIYGRGSADMKSGVAAMLFAADAVVRAGSFPGRIVVAALVDEEGMMSGVRDFVARGHAEGIDGAICCEPEGGEICITAKGAMRLRIDLTGKMAHGAMPFEGRNPNRAAAMVIAALTDLERRLQDVHGEHEQLGQPWITPTVLRAGEPAQMNVMPGTSALWVDVRTVPAVDHDRLLTDIERVGHRHHPRHRRHHRGHGPRRPPTCRAGVGPPPGARRVGCPHRRRCHAGAPRRRARYDRRHDADRAGRRADSRLRTGRQVDRPPG